MNEAERAALEKKFHELENAIAEHESNRARLPETVLEITLNALRAQSDEIKKQIAVTTGSGASAKGKGAKAAGERAAVVEGDAQTIITGDRSRVVETETYIEKQVVEGKEPIDPNALRQAYLHRVLNSTGTLSLEGVDPKAVSSGTDVRLRLGAVYTAMFIKDVETEKRKPGRDPMVESRRVSALEQLNRNKNLVLLGDPGSGKSTFVNFIAWCLAGEALGDQEANVKLLTSPLPDDDGGDTDKRQPWRHGALLPVRVLLRDFAARGLPDSTQDATAMDLWRYIVAELEEMVLGKFASPMYRELQEKGGIFLLDGLDEVPEANRRRDQIKQVVEEILSTFPRCRLLVTSRTYAYQRQDWRVAGMKESVLAPFSPGQIRRFVERWYAHIANPRGISAEDALGRAELLKRAIFSSERLRELGERPLLLTLMASLHAWRGGSLPEKREELYADAVDLLLDWWESPKIARDKTGKLAIAEPNLMEWLQTDREAMRHFLNELAFTAHARQPDLVETADIPEGELVSGLLGLSNNPDVKPKRLLKYLSQRAGLLIPRGVEVYTFHHRTFQEYLAACHLTHADYPEQAAGLFKEEPNRWREVVLLAGAKAARGSDVGLWSLVEELCHKPFEDLDVDLGNIWGAYMAGQLMVESADLKRVSSRNKRKRDLVREWLEHILSGDRLPAIERAAVGAVLGRLGDLRPGVMTLEEMGFCFIAGGPFWMGEKDDERLNEFLNYGYWMGQYPVTNSQFKEFVRADGYGNGRFWSEAEKVGVWQDGRFKGRLDRNWRSAPKNFGRPFNLLNHPDVGVTWFETLAFTRWLTKQWGNKGLLPNHYIVRLPTEAEWEKAARGGLKLLKRSRVQKTTEFQQIQENETGYISNPNPKREYPWEDLPVAEGPDSEKANYADTQVGATSAVGCFPAGESPYGVLDMGGNVWEWTQSIYKEYPYDPLDGREDLNASGSRVLRGGSYNDPARSLRCACRLGPDPVVRYWKGGFRVVVAPG